MQHPTPNGGKIVLAKGHGVELRISAGNVADYVFDHAHSTEVAQRFSIVCEGSRSSFALCYRDVSQSELNWAGRSRMNFIANLAPKTVRIFSIRN